MKLNRTKLTPFAVGCSLATALSAQNDMFRRTFLAGFFMILVLAHGQALVDTGAAAPAPIAYSTLQVISNSDSDAVIAEKAAKVLPRANQTDWMRLERTFFVHFGVNTFNGVEWGSGHEDPSIFNPSSLDANQWGSAMKNFGGKMVVLVCKHHDGFCLWPTRYTPHSVASSPWLGGKGDMVRAVANAARAHGLKLGVYLSPADLYQLRTNPKNPGGYYGDGSSNVLSVIPTDPASFKSDPAIGCTPPAGFTNYIYQVDDYNRYFLNQLYELLTEYGPIAEVWFDGANPDPSVKETYNYAAWYDLIRHLQPGAVIFGKGPDVRWVGSESGYGRTTEWSVISLPQPPDTFIWPDMTGYDLGSRAKLTPDSYLWWYPAEVNVTILANGQWFWSPKKHPRSLSQLVDIYYSSVGRNGNLILNLSPDTRGLIPDDQVEALSRMAQVVNETFATDLAAGGKLTADNSNVANGPSLALDGNLDTWWEAALGKTNGTLTLTLPTAVTFDVVSLQEAVDHRGQRIESFAVDVWNGSNWVAAKKISSDELTTVGHRRLIRLKSPVTTSQVRIRITGSRLEPTLAEIGLFKQAVAGLPPTISDRDTNGLVTISNTGGCKMVYTVDGTAPTTNSPVYNSPIVVPSGSTVQVACLMPNGQLGIVASKPFVGLPPTGWKVVGVDSQETAGADNAAANAIDGNSSTFWHTSWNNDLALPHYLTVDMGSSHRIAGFTYLPRQDGNPNGVVESYRFETSVDGRNWTTNVASGTFANIRNNPSLQEVTFAPVNARYFRFTALQEINANGWTSAAEISVLPAGGSGD
jgi:alpha-L-fucosidase